MTPTPAKSVAGTLALIVAYVAVRIGLPLTEAEDAVIASALIAVAGTLIHAMRAGRRNTDTSMADYVRGHTKGEARGIAKGLEQAAGLARTAATVAKSTGNPPASVPADLGEVADQLALRARAATAAAEQK